MRHASDQTVVITGASSGIGRATAHAFARRGASVVLCARGLRALEEAAWECRELGGRALAVPADTRDPEAVEELAWHAERAFGGIDVWVNNAASGAIGRYWEVPIEAHRATLETGLLGYVHGASAALSRFVAQGHGVLINTISIGGFIPTPYAAAYSAAKFGLRGFTRALQQELRHVPGVHACAIYPLVVDTPGIAHGANYTGHEIDAGGIVYAPETVAEAIVGLAERPRPELVLGTWTKLARLGHALAPGLVERGVAMSLERGISRGRPMGPQEGHLVDTADDHMEVHGGLQQPPMRLGTLALAAAGAGLGLFLARRAL